MRQNRNFSMRGITFDNENVKGIYLAREAHLTRKPLITAYRSYVTDDVIEDERLVNATHANNEDCYLAERRALLTTGAVNADESARELLRTCCPMLVAEAGFKTLETSRRRDSTS